MTEHVAYSFIVDAHPKFAYQGWHLAQSLQRHCAAQAADIHIQMTAEVADPVRHLFRNAGYRVHTLERFGDGKWCNKLAQLPNLLDLPFDRVVLLDTDTIAVADLRPFLVGDALQGKIVDLANPSLDVLNEIYATAGGSNPKLALADATAEPTFFGNANGGFYALPRKLAARFSAEWRRWATWLLANDEPLRRTGQLMHVDQVSAALAVQLSGIPFSLAPSNINYFVHFAAQHRYHNAELPIALIHYHDMSLNVLGVIEPRAQLHPAATAAVARANRQISDGFHNTLFWDYRYAAFPERGSGTGSRGDNLNYKRDLLRREGVEAAASILDVGCGDLEVLRGLNLTGYLGIDISPQAVARARLAKPDWEFALYARQNFEARDLVLCLEVLIHQTDLETYKSLISFLAEHVQKTLIVSGYDQKQPHHMVYFHEPLSLSLANSGRFKRIAKIGGHSDVVIYRCDV